MALQACNQDSARTSPPWLRDLDRDCCFLLAPCQAGTVQWHPVSMGRWCLWMLSDLKRNWRRKLNTSKSRCSITGPFYTKTNRREAWTGCPVLLWTTWRRTSMTGRHWNWPHDVEKSCR